MNLLVGYLAGLINVVFLCPMERVTTRVMVGGSEEKGRDLISVCRAVYERDGISGFYTGWTSTFYTATNPAIQNTVYDQVRHAYLEDAQNWKFREFLGAVSKMSTFLPSAVRRRR